MHSPGRKGAQFSIPCIPAGVLVATASLTSARANAAQAVEAQAGGAETIGAEGVPTILRPPGVAISQKED
jgi:hypothetical protein